LILMAAELNSTAKSADLSAVSREYYCARIRDPHKYLCL
jgi:hypothetical protein